MSRVTGYDSALRALLADVGDLVEKHESAGPSQSYREYADRPVAFLREVLKCEPWSAQVEIAESVLGHPRTAVRSSNAAGKDFLAARLALWWVFCRDGLVLVTGPTARQVQEVVFGELRRA